MSKLFIIGNGFDSAHGLRTTYDNFREFLLLEHPEINMEEFIAPEGKEQRDGGIEYDDNEVMSMLFYLINEAESDREKWSNIESSLGILNFSEAFDWHGDIVDKDGYIDLFKTARRNEDIASDLVIPIVTIQELFSQWINTIDITSIIPKKDFQILLGRNDKFLTFNYTETLENAYGIKKKDVCHIHGKQNEIILFGHGNPEDRTDEYQIQHIGSENSLLLINNQLRKDTTQALKNNSNFFINLKNDEIEAIYSYGFSFSEVDKIYLIKIFECIDTENIIWYFDDFDTSNHPDYKNELKSYGYKGNFDIFHIDN